jgi:hypothetical protein
MYQVIIAVCGMQLFKQLQIIRSRIILHVAAELFIICWKIVLLYNPKWEEVDWHLNIFKSVKQGSPIKILDVNAHVFGAFSAEDTVPH